MKKLFSLVLAVMLVAGIATSVFAEIVYTRSTDSRVYTDTRGSATAGSCSLSSSVTTNNRILGFTVSDSSAGSACLFDATTAATADAAQSTYIIGEVYCAAGGVSTVMYPMPKNITYGLVTRLANSTTSLTVYYE